MYVQISGLIQHTQCGIC